MTDSQEVTRLLWNVLYNISIVFERLDTNEELHNIYS
jgi:hypothetical protein